MESRTKTGKVYLQPHKAGKKWKPVWLSLFPHSSSGVGRLEIQDMAGGAVGGDHSGVRRIHQPQERKTKVVRLSELITVLRLPPNAEACPMENMSAFCVETQDRTMVFAARKDDCVEWVEKLCQSTFQRGGVSGSNQSHMEENQIYASVGEASEFWVVVQRTDAATRCGLQGSYFLQVGTEALLLKETQKKSVVSEWPYELLRRYGRDKSSLTIETGRRCESGPGTFTFETQQAEKIFSLVQSTIKRKTSPVTLGVPNQESEKIRPSSPLPKLPDPTDIAVILEKKMTTLERKPTALEEGSQEDLGGSSERVSAQPAPITLMPLPLIPSDDSSSSAGQAGGQSEAVYADPADCIKSVPKPHPATALYVDPACFLPLKPPSSRESTSPVPNPSAAQPCSNTHHPDPVYSEVYDKISPVHEKQTVIQSKGEVKGCAGNEPIYDEPMSQKEEVVLKNEIKTDPFAHLYAQVNKKTPSSSPSSSTTAAPTCSASSSSVSGGTTSTKSLDPDLDDVIYENLGII
ncbi:docking protein 1 isoform X1 [Xyrichtys novacula]|uniref:Docking protein 1 isoform X1 n=1 Tax=Xyrichtys novacula TaxID=13765 RepID=A0AAV1EZF9_XYRNO|nr:docking protein 1 isoform X1 [Xyrichtys novacula]